MKKINKGHIDFMAPFAMPKPQKHDGGTRQIDWDKLHDYIILNQINLESVSAGLAEDWTYTSGDVWNKEQGFIPQEETYVYGSSTWATPSIEVTDVNGNTEIFECWKLGNGAHDYFKEVQA